MNLTEEMQIVDSHSKIDAAVARIAHLRDAVGSALDIAVDFHGRVHAPMAKTLIHAIEPYSPLFVEEPVLGEHLEAMADLRRQTHIPIATGERLFSRFDFKNLFTLGAADIIQPDLSHAGGITECKKIADMAETWDIALAPVARTDRPSRLSTGGCSVSKRLHSGTKSGHSLQSSQRSDPLSQQPRSFNFTDGFVQIPQGPGLGIQINEDAVRQRAEEGHRWRNPIWRHPDGSIAEW